MPYVRPDESFPPLLLEATRRLGLSQAGLGDLLGASRRTVSRWATKGTSPSPDQIVELARAIYPLDAQLAAQIAEQTGTTLVALGLETPKADASARIPPTKLLVESIVCAAAEALDATPSVVRPVLRAAFERAHGLGLRIEQVNEALSTEPASTEAKPRKRRPVSA